MRVVKDYLPDIAWGPIALAFTAGIAWSGLLCARLPPLLALVVQSASVTVYIYGTIRQGRKRQNDLLMDVTEVKRISDGLSRGLLILFFCLGFLRLCGAAWPSDGKNLPEGFLIEASGVVEEIRALPESAYQGPRYQAVVRLSDHGQESSGAWRDDSGEKNLLDDQDLIGKPYTQIWQRQRKILLTIRFEQGLEGEAQGQKFGGEALVGATIQFSGEIYEGEGPRNPGEFDYNRYLCTKGIYCRGDAKGGSVQISRKSSSWRRLCERIRSGLIGQAERYVGQKEAAIIAGCFLGDQTLMEQEDKEIYRKAGIAHLFSVSGTHGGMILALALHLERFGPFRKYKKTVRVIAIGFLLFYLNLTRFPLSMQRTFLMACIMQGAVFLDRRGDSVNAFAATVLYLLWLYPQSLFGAGFQLSFGVALGIIHLHPWLQRRMPSWLAVPVAAQLAAMPIQAYWFYQIQPVGFLLNIWAVALTPPILFLSGLAALTGVCSPPLAAIVWQAPGLLAAALDRSAAIWTSLPFATLNVKEYSWPVYILWGLLLWFIPSLRSREAALDQWFYHKYRQKKRQSDWRQWEAWRSARQAQIMAGQAAAEPPEARPQAGEPQSWMKRDGKEQSIESQEVEAPNGKGMTAAFHPVQVKADTAWLIWQNRRKIGAAAMAICLALVFLAPKPLQVFFLDVGQGDGLVIIMPSGNVWMVDGGSSSVNRLAAYRLDPFLRSQGVNRLDYLLVTHSDTDHIAGVQELLVADWPVGSLLLSPQTAADEKGRELAALAEGKGAEVILFSKGQTIRDGEISLKCLYPEGDAWLPEEAYSSSDTNESSLVVELSYKKFSLLLTGDIDSRIEEGLMGHWSATSLLKVAHHGSRYSTSEAFLGEVKPLAAVVSSSKNNIYGHPHPDTLKRLEDAGSRVYLTMDTGAIQVVTDGNHVRIRSFLASSAPAFPSAFPDEKMSGESDN